MAEIPHNAKEIVINIDGNTLSPHVETKSESPSFFDFIEKTAAQMRSIGKIRTAETYLCAMNRLRRYRDDISLDSIDHDLMEAYETHLKHSGLMPNTIAFYMRTLRAAYNRAVEKGLVGDSRPFAKLHTALGKTEKRAVSAECIRRLAECRTNDAEEEFARDMFLFSFYTRGMAWIDMAYLRKSDIRNGQLVYYRKKTGQRIAIKWDWRMRRIVDKYQNNEEQSAGGYLLPIITKRNGKERNQLRYRLGKVNATLKDLSLRLNTERRLTMYVARHSWASIARSLNIPMHIISSGMGHNSEKTTMVYMKSLDASTIDEANQRIMDFIG